MPQRSAARSRIRLDLLGRDGQSAEVARLLELGARRVGAGDQLAAIQRLDLGPFLDLARDERGVVLADPEGNLVVVEGRATFADTGPLAVLSLESADPDRDAEFWSWLTGWTPTVGSSVPHLRDASLRGPVLELRAETAAKGGGKNPSHLDVRLEVGDDPDDAAAGIAERGGRELHPGWGELPWRLYADPSGNEFCVLPASS